MRDLSVVVCLALDRRSSIEGLAKFKACISKCPFVDTTLEVSGSFDLIVEGRCASLEEYTQQLDSLRPQLAEFVARFEANFVGKRIDQEEQAVVIWLPCEGGHRQAAAHLIDKIIAEGDYMRVHMAEWSCLVHSTMRALRERLGKSQFIQLHRSTLVRISFIERLLHDQLGWRARLRDQTTVKVGRSHISDALRLISGEVSRDEDIRLEEAESRTNAAPKEPGDRSVATI